MSRIGLPLLLALAMPGVAAAQAFPAGVPVPGVPSKDVLFGTLENGRRPSPDICTRYRELHAERLFVRPRNDVPRAGREILLVDPGARDIDALRQAGFIVDETQTSRGSDCSTRIARYPGEASFISLAAILDRIAPDMVWVSAGK